MKKEYLGDGVYVWVDASWQIWLSTSYAGHVGSQIALEPVVLQAFLDYIKRYKAELKKG